MIAVFVWVRTVAYSFYNKLLFDRREKSYLFFLANNYNFDTILYCVFSISAIYRIIFLLSPLSYSLTIYLIFKY